MYRILRRDLNSPSKFKEKLHDYIVNIREEILKQYNIELDYEEVGDLLLSACRSDDFNVIQQQENKMFLDEGRIWNWVNKKLIPKYSSRKLG